MINVLDVLLGIAAVLLVVLILVMTYFCAMSC